MPFSIYAGNFQEIFNRGFFFTIKTTTHDLDFITEFLTPETSYDLSREEMDELGFCVEYDLRKWIMGREPTEHLREWLKKNGFDLNERKEVKWEVLMAELKDMIPKSAILAADIGAEIYQYDLNKKQTRGEVIDGRIAYNVIRVLNRDGEIIPGKPQELHEGIWMGIAYSGDLVKEFEKSMDKEIKEARKKRRSICDIFREREDEYKRLHTLQDTVMGAVEYTKEEV